MASVFCVCLCDCICIDTCIFVFVPELYSRSKQGGAIKAQPNNSGVGMSAGAMVVQYVWHHCGSAMVVPW